MLTEAAQKASSPRGRAAASAEDLLFRLNTIEVLQRIPPPEDWRDDMTRGLQVITSRTESLSRFTAAYARLARLPAPKLAPTVLAPLVKIGLVFCRQIAEAHEGSLKLENQPEGRGARATLTLPL